MKEKVNTFTSLTFEQILKEIKEENTKLTRDIKNGLEDKGINLAIRTIQAYTQGVAVPKYETAKAIFEILNIEGISDNQLMSILQESRSQLKAEQSGEGIIKKYIMPDYLEEKNNDFQRYKVTLRNDDFDFLSEQGLPNDASIELINKRVQELYGNDRQSFSRYVKNLINEDMKRI